MGLRLYDSRDIVFVRFALAASCMLPAAAALYLWFSWWFAAAYLAVWGAVFMDRFTLMLHCTVHRPLFKSRMLNRYIPWVLGPFFGQTPETYLAHHLGMHHVEGNLWRDLSSTLRYRRDRFRDWLKYFARFLFAGIFELVDYFRRKGNRKLARRVAFAEGGFWAVVVVLTYFHWQATLVVFLFPVLLMRVLMMAGNWGQHAFVDSEDPGNDFRSSITSINTRYNRRCFNDGYHIAHHRFPRLHYTELPAEFEAHRALYGSQDAVVFDGIDFFGVWLCLMTGSWNRLARAFVRLPGAPERTHEEVVEFLRRRVRPVPRGGVTASDRTQARGFGFPLEAPGEIAAAQDAPALRR